MEAIVLAAGKGTRMRSDRPKVLHTVHGLPLVSWSLRALRAAGADHVVVVVGHRAAEVEAAARDEAHRRNLDVSFALQARQRGTGDAVRVALAHLRDPNAPAVVVPGDVPGLRPATIRAVADAVGEGVRLALVTFRPEDPGAYGRVLAGPDGSVRRIVEAADATDEERAVGLCNAGIYAARGADLGRWLTRVDANNAQGEIYLTDVVALAAAEGRVAAVEAPEDEVFGINDPDQLARAHHRLPPPARAPR